MSGYLLDTDAISIRALPSMARNAVRSDVARFRTWVREHDDHLFLSAIHWQRFKQVSGNSSAEVPCAAPPRLPIGLAPSWSFTIQERCRLRRPPLSKLAGCSIAQGGKTLANCYAPSSRQARFERTKNAESRRDDDHGQAGVNSRRPGMRPMGRGRNDDGCDGRFRTAKWCYRSPVHCSAPPRRRGSR